VTDALTRPLVIFDFDGVIVDSLAIHLAAYQRVFRLAGRSLPVETAAGWREWYDSAWEQNFLRAGFTEGELRANLSGYFELLEYGAAPVYPGVPAQLAALSQHCRLIVLSSTPDAIVTAKLEAEGLLGFFEQVHATRHGSRKHEQVAELVQARVPGVGRAVMIGDTAADIRAGKAAGIHTVGVTWGWYAPDRITLEQPSRVIHDPAELAATTGSLLGEDQ